MRRAVISGKTKVIQDVYRYECVCHVNALIEVKQWTEKEIHSFWDDKAGENGKTLKEETGFFGSTITRFRHSVKDLLDDKPFIFALLTRPILQKWAPLISRMVSLLGFDGQHALCEPSPLNSPPCFDEF